MNAPQSDRKEGVIAAFDSGVGGLSVFRHLQSYLPAETLLYFADQAHVPYGKRPSTQVNAFSHAITRFLLKHDAKMVVVPCNTASAAALETLRNTFPHIPFVGMEPAVKPAAAHTNNGKVGVLATMSTLESERYARLMHRFARDVEVFENPCVGLVDLIEVGETTSANTEALLRSCLQPMLDKGVDTVVLGCTHFPFVLPLIDKIVGTAVTVIDPAPAVALQAVRVLQQHHLETVRTPPASAKLITSGSKDELVWVAQALIGYQGEVETAVWQPNQTVEYTRFHN
ncbi:MAG: glutamate racemase [Chloroflexi bacterium]|nr:glutamate racemase [Chloroflexota bacterium]